MQEAVARRFLSEFEEEEEEEGGERENTREKLERILYDAVV
jgi:hypothetical protein